MDDIVSRLTAIEKQLAVLLAQQAHMSELAEHERKQRERHDDDLRKLFVAQSDMASSIAMLTARAGVSHGGGQPAAALAGLFGLAGTAMGFAVGKLVGLQ